MILADHCPITHPGVQLCRLTKSCGLGSCRKRHVAYHFDADRRLYSLKIRSIELQIYSLLSTVEATGAHHYYTVGWLVVPSYPG